jgi:hypothetical protein
MAWVIGGGLGTGRPGQIWVDDPPKLPAELEHDPMKLGDRFYSPDLAAKDPRWRNYQDNGVTLTAYQYCWTDKGSQQLLRDSGCKVTEVTFMGGIYLGEYIADHSDCPFGHSADDGDYVLRGKQRGRLSTGVEGWVPGYWYGVQRGSFPDLFRFTMPASAAYGPWRGVPSKDYPK